MLAQEEEKRGSDEDSDEASNEEDENTQPPKKTNTLSENLLSYKDILKTLLINSLPIFLSLFAVHADKAYALYLLKHKNSDKELIAASGVGAAWLSVLGTHLFTSLNLGLTTKTSQAFGAKKLRLVGLYLHRAFIINLCLLVPSIIILIISDRVFIMLGVATEIVDLTYKYLLYCIPGLFTFLIYNTLVSTLYGCGMFKIPSLIQVTSALLYLMAAYLFIDVFDLELRGQAICYNIMWTFSTILLISYFWKHRPLKEIFFWPIKESYKEIWDLFKYEIVIGSMNWFDSIAAEILSIFTATLNVAHIAAYSISKSIYKITNPIASSIGTTSMSFAGNAIGSNNKENASRFIIMALRIGLFCCLIVEFVLWFWKDEILDIFSPDSETFSVSQLVLGVYILKYPGDAFQKILGNALKAIGKEKAGSLIITLSNYVVGVPVAYLTCFKMKLGAEGIAIGAAAAVYVKAFLFGLVYWKTNLDHQIKKVSVALEEKDQKIEQFNESEIELVLNRRRGRSQTALDLEDNVINQEDAEQQPS